MKTVHWVSTLALALTSAQIAAPMAVADTTATQVVPPGPGARHWLDSRLDPDARARLLLARMERAEKVSLVHGVIAVPIEGFAPLGLPKIAAVHVPGVERLGIPALYMTDGSLGIAYVNGLRHDDGATALPSSLMLAASFDEPLAYSSGVLLGKEARAKGMNVLLGGGVNLVREPRGGRNFEYLSEDPLVSGVLGGETIRGIQDQNVIATVKHFAFNNQESGRKSLDVRISPEAARESDLLAFEIAIERGKPASVMCSYNRVDGDYACESPRLLNDVLKRDWKYPGWVMSDCGAVHGTASALTGLDQQTCEQLDEKVWFGKELDAAVRSDPAYARRLDDMVTRILRSMFAVGIFDHPVTPGPIEAAANAATAQRIAEEGIVLLKNDRGILPLARSARRIAIIGGHADIAVLSGGGSTQVAPKEGPAVTLPQGASTPMEAIWHTAFFMPSSPLQSIKEKVPDAQVTYNDGIYPSAVADLARKSDIVIVFASQWTGEAYDVPDLTLPAGQDAMIAAAAAANPNTIVVLENGGPVLMPWVDKVGAVIEAWYPGIRGGPAIADILFGDVNPSGHLPVTFPRSPEQLPSPELKGWGLARGTRFNVDYREGADVGYKWFARKGYKPLFPFGFGLSYTDFALSDLAMTNGRSGLEISLTVTNTGKRAGATVPQAYLTRTPSGRAQRLLGWQRVSLEPGASQRVTIRPDARLLAGWNSACGCWKRSAGSYSVSAGQSAQDLALERSIVLPSDTARP